MKVYTVVETEMNFSLPEIINVKREGDFESCLNNLVFPGLKRNLGTYLGNCIVKHF